MRKGRNITWSDGVPVTFNGSYVIETNNTQICVKNWCQALQYCRHVSSDLVSISNESQNDEVIKKGNNASFWIGLMHDEWEWVDKSCSFYRNWSCEPEPKLPMSNHCGVINNAHKWSDENCWRKLPFLCEEKIVFMN
uniref:C-type lectin domain-containing protein n=1 Tax=Sander lucioperca TaxID=283035 RepID=A0A8C9YDR2_SANLU